MHQLSVLCGGSGSSKFALAITRGLAQSSRVVDARFFSNVGDNFWHYGLYICPDVDILLYALAGMLDESKGWGITGDTFVVRDTLRTYDKESAWFNLGDRDFALSVRRTELLTMGRKRLSEITEELRGALKIKYPVIPSSDDPVETHVKTANGWMHLQEFWVKNKAALEPLEVRYDGIESAKPNPNLAILPGSTVLCPANPITSILPIVNLKGVRESLRRSKTIAISPFVGDKPYSGPAGVLMKALGLEASSYGVAKLYSDFLRIMLVDKNEECGIIRRIRDLGVECVSRNTRLANEQDKLSFWNDLSELL